MLVPLLELRGGEVLQRCICKNGLYALGFRWAPHEGRQVTVCGRSSGPIGGPGRRRRHIVLRTIGLVAGSSMQRS